jgi:hypothetical protein
MINHQVIVEHRMEVTLAWFKVLSLHLPGGTKRNQEKPQSAGVQAKIWTRTFRIPSRNVKHYSMTFSAVWFHSTVGWSTWQQVTDGCADVCWHSTDFTIISWLCVCAFMGPIKVQLWMQKEWSNSRIHTVENSDNLNTRTGTSEVKLQFVLQCLYSWCEL